MEKINRKNTTSGVPTTTTSDLENNGHQKKYTVNQSPGKNLVISRPLCTLMAIGALLLAVLVGLVVFFLIPRTYYCNGKSENLLAALVKKDSATSFSENEKLSSILTTVEVNERLPRSIKPLHYMIEIKPDFQRSISQGVEQITIRALEETNIIIFHANKIKIRSDSLTLRWEKSTTPMKINYHDYLEGERYKISCEEKLEKDKNYIITIEFEGELNNQLQGFYLSNYTDHHYKQERLTASTQFSPTDARRAFPCFDEPSLKARFKIKLARPANMTSLSNMPLSKTELFETPDGKWYWDEYPDTPEMPTYLVAFVIGDIIPNNKSKDKRIKIWSRAEYLEQTHYAGEIAPIILRYFEDYFQAEFPLSKIDIVGLPEFGFTAMENWGLIIFREGSLLFDEENSSVDDERTVATVLAHEIAHQWFGNLVTPKWWNDLWLKEGFATYLQYLGVQHAEPSWNVMEEFLPGEIERAMAFDSLESSRPISFNVYNSRQIKQAFDEISYAKGACIIRMMNHFLGEETFLKGLIKFLQKYQYSNADRTDLFATLTEEANLRNSLPSNITVKQIMDTWTEQAGFPVINVLPDYKRNTLTFIQKRFLITNNSNKDNATWWLPISYTPSLDPDYSTRPIFWMRGEKRIEVKVDTIGQWYLLNLNQTGYYIVNYDENNWRQLIFNLMELPTIIWAQLISDSMDLARANQLDYDIPLRLIAKMGFNDQKIMFVPTAVALKKLEFLNDMLYNTPVYGLFEDYHKSVFSNHYRAVDVTDNVDDYLTRRIRKVVLEWACKNSDSECVHQSRQLFRDWQSMGKPVPPNLRSIVYCAGIREGTEREWNFAYDNYMDPNEQQSITQKNHLLDSLGCTKIKWLLSRYLDKLIDGSSIRIQDADRVFESVAQNKEGSKIAFDFIRDNWDELLKHYGDSFNILGKMIQALAMTMNTEYQLEEFERFRDSIKSNISTTTMVFNSAIEKVKSNVEWMEKNYEQIEDWLLKHHNQFSYL